MVRPPQKAAGSLFKEIYQRAKEQNSKHTSSLVTRH